MPRAVRIANTDDLVIVMRWSVVPAGILLLLIADRPWSIGLPALLIYAAYTAGVHHLVRRGSPTVRATPFIDVAMVAGLTYLFGPLESDVYHFYYLAIIVAGALWAFPGALGTATLAGISYAVVAVAAGMPPEFLRQVAIRSVYLLLLGAAGGYLGTLQRQQVQSNRALARARGDLQLYADQMAEMAMTDDLTGLANYRALRQHLDTVFADPEQVERGIAFIFFDLDHYKGYNDRFGHLMGNDMLQQVAQILRASVRPQDFVARYGGEEFAVVMLDIDVADAERAAERVRKAVERRGRHRFDTIPGGALTISGAVAYAPHHGGTAAEVLNAADNCLYRAKDQGRNRILIAGQRV